MDAGSPTSPSTRHTIRDKIPARGGQELADTYRDNFRFNMACYRSMVTQSTETGAGQCGGLCGNYLGFYLEIVYIHHVELT